MLPKSAAPRIVVLKDDRLYGELICRQIKDFWRNAQAQFFQRGLAALVAIQASTPDLFITGVKIEDMDGLEHLEPFIEQTLPILIVTSRRDPRTCSLLRSIRYDGIYDGHVEGLENLRIALESVLERGHYISPTFDQHVKKPKNLTLDVLTDKEQMVLSIIGDGSDDQQAAIRLGLSPYTVNTHRKTIMGKLGLHHKGELVIYAVQQGYVQINQAGINYPGFQRRIRASSPDKKRNDDRECA